MTDLSPRQELLAAIGSQGLYGKQRQAMEAAAERYAVRMAVPASLDGLDVERLARALHATHAGQLSYEDDRCKGFDADEAADIAREYAALREGDTP